MKTWLFGMTLLGALAMTGCSGLHTTPTDVDDMPGSDHMAQGPGIFAQHSAHADKNGLVVYSGNPLASSDETSKAPPKPNGSATPASQASFKAFQDFQAYQRFLALPKDAPERRRFEAWLKWQHCDKASSTSTAP